MKSANFLLNQLKNLLKFEDYYRLYVTFQFLKLRYKDSDSSQNDTLISNVNSIPDLSTDTAVSFSKASSIYNEHSSVLKFIIISQMLAEVKDRNRIFSVATGGASYVSTSHPYYFC